MYSTFLKLYFLDPCFLLILVDTVENGAPKYRSASAEDLNSLIVLLLKYILTGLQILEFGLYTFSFCVHTRKFTKRLSFGLLFMWSIVNSSLHSGQKVIAITRCSKYFLLISSTLL